MFSDSISSEELVLRSNPAGSKMKTSPLLETLALLASLGRSIRNRPIPKKAAKAAQKQRQHEKATDDQ